MILNKIKKFLQKRIYSRENKKIVKYHKSDLVGYIYDVESINLINGRKDEENLHKSWVNFLKKNNIKMELFIDIGAYTGTTTLQVCDKFKEIWAFEPVLKTYELLKINTREIKNIKTYKLALGEGACNMTMQSGEGFISGSSLNFQPNCVNSEIVNVIALDEMVGELNHSSVTMKIDVETFEINVLKGAVKLIMDKRPIIIIEILKRTVSNGTSNSFEYLKKLGYKFYNPQPTYQNIILRNIFKQNYKITHIEVLEKKHNLYKAMICVPTEIYVIE